MSVKVSIDEKAGEVVIRLPLIKPPQPSKTGRTLIVAYTKGNVQTDVDVNGESLYIGCNCYIYATPKKGDRPQDPETKPDAKKKGT